MLYKIQLSSDLGRVSQNAPWNWRTSQTNNFFEEKNKKRNQLVKCNERIRSYSFPFFFEEKKLEKRSKR